MLCPNAWIVRLWNMEYGRGGLFANDLPFEPT